MIDFSYFYASGHKVIGVERDQHRETTLKAFATTSEATDFAARAQRMFDNGGYDAGVFEAINSEAQARAERATA